MYFLADNSDNPKLVIALEAHWSACQLKSLNAVSTTFCTSVTLEPTSMQSFVNLVTAAILSPAAIFLPKPLNILVACLAALLEAPVSWLIICELSIPSSRAICPTVSDIPPPFRHEKRLPTSLSKQP